MFANISCTIIDYIVTGLQVYQKVRNWQIQVIELIYSYLYLFVLLCVCVPMQLKGFYYNKVPKSFEFHKSF